MRKRTVVSDPLELIHLLAVGVDLAAPSGRPALFGQNRDRQQGGTANESARRSREKEWRGATHLKKSIDALGKFERRKSRSVA